MEDDVVQQRAQLTAAQINDLPDSAFAYIEPGGTLDEDGRTVPRSLRHYPVHDEAHARNALSRANAALQSGDQTAREVAEKAMPKILAACEKFGIESKSAAPGSEQRLQPAAGGDAAKPAPVLLSAKRAFGSLMERPPAHPTQFEVRMAGEDHSALFVGYASTTGDGYDVRDWLGDYVEEIHPGAFSKTLREQQQIPLLFNHDGIPLANTASGTSRLAEDGRGLRNEAVLDLRQSLANDLCIGMQRGDVNKMSFSFQAVKDDWNGDYTRRTVTECRLFDTSIVTYPANPNTTAELVDQMRMALGREGRSLWLADHELSVRTALPALERREAGQDALELLERALRALTAADEQVASRAGLHGRARTFRLARCLLEMRAGKVLSQPNHQLVKHALDVLSGADSHHQKVAAAHQEAQGALADVLAAATASDGGGGEGMDANQGGGATGENPIMPSDGAGARATTSPLALKRARERELYQLRHR